MRGPCHGSLPASTAEYVNLREPSMDMKSVTDRAAQTLLWTELIRGGPGGQEARGGLGGIKMCEGGGAPPPCLCRPQAWA